MLSMSIVHLLTFHSLMTTSHIARPRFSSVRPFMGVQQREASSSGEFVAGVTLYRNLPDGGEAYEVNYLSLGVRSDTAQNMLEALQGNDLTVRRVGDNEADEPYVGTLQQNTKLAEEGKADAKSEVKADSPELSVVA